MRILVVAQAPEEFLAWEQNALTRARPPHDEAAARGAHDFATMTCVKCHDIAGNGEGARAGPDLTHLAERATLGAGVMKNSPAELDRWLKDPQAIKEGSHMPNVQLTDAQVADFVTYFETLR
jgi:cytochrome c oxidase subunit 2